MGEVALIDVSCSSEDPVFPAINLLNGAYKSHDERKQWLCSRSTEESAFVILKYAEPFVISSIELKNSGSAFIQIEGGSSDEPTHFKVLWRMQTCMSPAESQTGRNGDTTYIFLSQDMLDVVQNLKYDILKIICCQPFTTDRKYGLSYVIARSALSVSLKIESPEKLTLGQNNLHEWSQGVSNISGCYQNATDTKCSVLQLSTAGKTSFTHVKTERSGGNSSDNLNHTGLVSISSVSASGAEPYGERDVSKRFISSSIVDNVETQYDHNENFQEDESPILKKEPVKVELSDDDDEEKEVTPLFSCGNIRLPSPACVHVLKRSLPQSSDGCMKKKAKETPRVYKPFNRLLEGVQVVISGFVNPQRSEIRSRALRMGALYSPYWTENSTHLVCAFLYTPKYQQALGEGLIVTHQWIDECFRQRRRLPWRRFALNISERRDGDSESEIWELLPNTSHAAAGSSSSQTEEITHRSTSHVDGAAECSPSEHSHIQAAKSGSDIFYPNQAEGSLLSNDGLMTNIQDHRLIQPDLSSTMEEDLHNVELQRVSSSVTQSPKRPCVSSLSSSMKQKARSGSPGWLCTPSSSASITSTSTLRLRPVVLSPKPGSLDPHSYVSSHVAASHHDNLCYYDGGNAPQKPGNLKAFYCA